MLYLIRGWPGSGKSTKAKELLTEGLIDVYFEADMYFESSKLGYVFDPKLIPQAHAWCLRKTKEALSQGKNVAVSNTFIKLWEAQKYMDLGFPYEIIECSGLYQNTHNVPVDKVVSMRASYEEFK